MIDSVHAQFVAAVVGGRRMEEAKVRELADGRIFSGEQARTLGLVDALGGLQEAIAMAGERAGIVGEPRVTRARVGREPWWLRLLLGNLTRLGMLPARQALGLQLIYGGPFLR
jgi:protease-4